MQTTIEAPRDFRIIRLIVHRELMIAYEKSGPQTVKRVPLLGGPFYCLAFICQVALVGIKKALEQSSIPRCLLALDSVTFDSTPDLQSRLGHDLVIVSPLHLVVLGILWRIYHLLYEKAKVK